MSTSEPSLNSSRTSNDWHYWLAGFLFCACLIGVSIWLTPAEKGYGTHTQLGLPRCSFQQMTGVPGPSCGMTTAFAHMSSGQLIQAVRSNLFGALFYLVILMSGVEALLKLCSVNLSPVTAMARYARPRHLFVAVTLWLLSWILKLHIIAGHI